MTPEEREQDLQAALRCLNEGGILLYPTDTVWGLGCDATNEEAVERLFMLKRRPEAKAMLSLADSTETLKKYLAVFPREAQEAMEKSERPLTVIYRHPVGIPEMLKAEDGSAAFRIPREGYTRELCRRLGKPLVSTSANFSGEHNPSTYDEISGEIKKAADYVCRFGREDGKGIPSRIIKMTDSGEVTVIRE